MGLMTALRMERDLKASATASVSYLPAKTVQQATDSGGLTASSQRLRLTKAADMAVLKDRPYAEWQREAWGHYDSIGEIKFAFTLLANIGARVRLYPSVDVDPGAPPVSLYDLLKRKKKFSESEIDEDDTLGLDIPKDLTEEVQQTMLAVWAQLQSANGGMPSLLRAYYLNMSVAGECYLCKIDGKWSIRSSEEVSVGRDNKPMLKTLRSSTGLINNDTSLASRSLPLNTYIGRIWNPHPRFSMEPDSSMIAIRELCDELLTLQRMIRIVTRSQMHAGGLFIPDGISAAAGTPAVDMAEPGEIDYAELEEDSIEHELIESWGQAVADEASMTTIIPVILRGPAELGEKIKPLELLRKADKELVERADTVLNRILQGLDAAKEVVQGLDNVSYRNAEIITEQLFRSHVEPPVINFVSSLNSMLVRPMVKARHPEISDDTLNKIGLWYSPDSVVVDPDRKATANEAYDRYLISGDAWRQRLGFSDAETPSQEELAMRMALKDVTPPELASTIVQHALKSVFDNAKQAAASALPPSAQRLLSQGAEEVPAPEEDVGV